MRGNQLIKQTAVNGEETISIAPGSEDGRPPISSSSDALALRAVLFYIHGVTQLGKLHVTSGTLTSCPSP